MCATLILKAPFSQAPQDYVLHQRVTAYIKSYPIK